MIRSPAGFDGGDRIKRYLDYYQPSYGVMMLSAGQAFSPASLFAAGEQGVWYDPSDFSTMFQDAAGTTPVTAVEQPVGRILDKSGRGNHATQSTTTPPSRPVLSARVNLLTYSEQFDNAVWVKDGLKAFGSGSVANTTATTDPLGGNTADFIQENTSNSTHGVLVNGVSVNNGPTYTYIVHCKAAGRSWAYIRLAWLAGQGAFFDLATGTVGTVQAGITASITSVGNGWYMCSVSIASGTTNIYPAVGPAAGDNQSSYTGDGTSGIYIWGADLRPTNQTTLLPAYQRIAAATDYDTTGFPYYLKFDGTDDSMATGTITPGIDKAQVFAGVRKQSDVPGIIAETGVNSGSFGAFYLVNENTPSSNFSYAGRGARIGTLNDATNAAVASPATAVITAQQDINGGTPATIRRNGSLAGSSVSTTFGGGNFLAYPLYIGRRTNSVIPFNGNLYSLIVRFGSNLDATTISNTETWVNGKTLAY